MSHKLTLCVSLLLLAAATVADPPGNAHLRESDGSLDTPISEQLVTDSSVFDQEFQGRASDERCGRRLALIEHEVSRQQKQPELKLELDIADSRAQYSSDYEVVGHRLFDGTSHESCIQAISEHPNYDALKPALERIKKVSLRGSGSPDVNSSEASSDGSRISESISFGSASYGDLAKVYWDSACRFGPVYMDFCTAYHAGFKSVAGILTINIGDVPVTINACLLISGSLCPPPPVPVPPVGCTANLPAVDSAAKTELLSYPKEPFERRFALTCTGSSIHVRDKFANSPPAKGSEGYETWDPCVIPIPPTQEAVAYAHSHPYFRNYYPMNVGAGCGNSLRDIKVDHTNQHARDFNEKSWKFSDHDKEWVTTMRAPLYLISGLRGNQVWFLDVEAAGHDRGNGRHVK